MTQEKATFAAGCFWGVESMFRRLDGVLDAAVGYTGGTTVDPTYEDICHGDTNHAEAVEVSFDPARISYEALLTAFWNCHNPTTRNRQGPDVGSQYRSAIFCHSPAQQTAAEASRDQHQLKLGTHHPVVTEIVAADTFYRAEEYHQRYLEKHGRGHC